MSRLYHSDLVVAPGGHDDSPSLSNECMLTQFLNRRKKWIKRTFQFVVFALVLIGLSLAIGDVVDRWQQVEFTGQVRWRFLVLASILYGIGLLPPSRVLQLVTRAISPTVATQDEPGVINGSLDGVEVSGGEHVGGKRISTVDPMQRSAAPAGRSVSWIDFAAAQLLGHVGKYVPGKAFVVVLRASALSPRGVDPMAVSIAIFVETFLMMAVGSVAAGVILVAASFNGLVVPAWVTASAGAIAVLAVTATLPVVLRVVVSRLTGSSDQQLRSSFTGKLVARSWFWSLVGWIFVSSSLIATVMAMPTFDAMRGDMMRGDTVFADLVMVSAVASAGVMLAMVIGFASLLPGGAGIRELTLTTVLGVVVDPATALLSALALRGVFLGTEMLLAAIAWIFLKRTHYNASHG